MTANAPKVFRFAPSPNGYLHLGHAYSALRNHDLARRHGGRLLVRLEDIDIDRCRREYETALLDDLAWLGIEWEKPERRQSEHFAEYAARLEDLRRRRLVYPCFCSRGDISRIVAGAASWPRDPDGAPLYPGTCKHMSKLERERRLAAGQHAALRIDMDEALAQVGERLGWREYGEGDVARDVEAEPAVWGDAVVGRRDIPASYHIAVVVDDALQGVTDIVRGMDLFNATSLHRLLQNLLDLPAPEYHHHELLRDGAGNKLSKSTRAKSIRSIRSEGLTPADLRTRFRMD
jgi:glutamyl-Q tRNA(Asp) synthetase